MTLAFVGVFLIASAGCVGKGVIGSKGVTDSRGTDSPQASPETTQTGEPSDVQTSGVQPSGAQPSGVPANPTPSPTPSPTTTPVATATGPLPSKVPSGVPMRFGLDADSRALQLASGVKPDYGSLWIGKWNLEQGWREPDAQLKALRAANITPAIQYYYWGDDLGPSCIEKGCHGKSVAGWERLGQQLAEHLQADLKGAPALVVLETEFNKGSVARYEAFDGMLAQRATELKAAYPAAVVALGFGNWNSPAWGVWDRAAAASDLIGLQAMVGSTRATGGGDGLFNATLAGVRTLAALFGKRLIVQDVAIPSGPAPAALATQAKELSPFLARLGELKEAGVDAILYRAFVDNPVMPLDNYFGEAERHFGLAAAGTGALKPAGELWIAAMAAQQPA